MSENGLNMQQRPKLSSVRLVKMLIWSTEKVAFEVVHKIPQYRHRVILIGETKKLEKICRELNEVLQRPENDIWMPGKNTSVPDNILSDE